MEPSSFRISSEGFCITSESNGSLVAHPQGNEAIEAANKMIFQGKKKRLGEAKESWAEELPWVLWAYRTTPRSSTGETPFRLAYGTDLLVPVKEKEAAHQRNIKYSLQAAQHYDSGIKKRSFGVGDLVLRELVTSMPTRQGNLQPKWEGPYKLMEIVHPGTYKLEILASETIKNTWHASRLRKFYQ
ncbi:uncharacterized protein LOC141720188 [Apium graveolens]|uniref:uncharacterized protein LOC141720188 n=1 Tax=Apium graveolens TaxID=4045 RepID=UPI003D79A9A6